ncbi:sterol desaturase family protein [soil metagenome]
MFHGLQINFNEQILLLISTPLYALVIAFEIIMSHLRAKGYYSIRETITNIWFTVSNAAIDLIIRGIYLLVLVWFYKHRLIDTWTMPVLYWFLLFILEDLAFYVEHSVDHYCRLFWAVHVTHHSSEEFNLTTGFRSSVLQPVYRFLYFIPIALLGFQPIDILFMFSLTQVYGVLVHTQYIKKMPAWFETVFVSPAHHRVHHASNIIYLDKNMGMVLIIWDRIFGTFQEELKEEPVKFGITKELEFRNHPVKMITHEFSDLAKDLKKDLPWSIRLKYLLMAPGWSHDGSTQTAKELRIQMGIEKLPSNNFDAPTDMLVR